MDRILLRIQRAQSPALHLPWTAKEWHHLRSELDQKYSNESLISNQTSLFRPARGKTGRALDAKFGPGLRHTYRRQVAGAEQIIKVRVWLLRRSETPRVNTVQGGFDIIPNWMGDYGIGATATWRRGLTLQASGQHQERGFPQGRQSVAGPRPQPWRWADDQDRQVRLRRAGDAVSGPSGHVRLRRGHHG